MCYDLVLCATLCVQVRRQHRLNLGAVMRHAMLSSDYCTAAGAVGALLGCQVGQQPPDKQQQQLQLQQPYK
jgi:hypothetical protein